MTTLDRNPTTKARIKRNARRIRGGLPVSAATTAAVGGVLKATAVANAAPATAPTVTGVANPGSADQAATNAALAALTVSLNLLKDKINQLLAAQRVAGQLS